MVNIPSQIDYEHMLSHMLPGFFIVITIFMILDIWSPLNLTLLIVKDTNALISSVGLIFVFGTILGVIIDGLHHKYLEQKYFRYFEKHNKEHWNITYDEIVEYFKNCKCKARCDPTACVNFCNCKFRSNKGNDLAKIYYFFDIEQLEAYIAIYDHLRKTKFHYYEFYANTFIAMLPFTFVAPIYIQDQLGIGVAYSIIIAIIISFLTYTCLDSSLLTYRHYLSALYYSYCSCTEKINSPSVPREYK